MNRKKFLITGTSLTILFGVIAASSPFLKSMNPTARADAALPRFNIKDIPIGELTILEESHLFDGFNGYTYKVLVYKVSHTEIKAWEAPVKNGRVGMPDLQWWRPFHLCNQLKVLRVDNSPIITCLDRDISEWWRNEWRWTLEGKNLGTSVDDLATARGVIEGGYFVFGKKNNH